MNVFTKSILCKRNLYKELCGEILHVGVKNGHEEVNIQISIEINMNVNLRKVFFEKVTFTKSLAVKHCTNLGAFIGTKEHVHETSEKDANKVAT